MTAYARHEFVLEGVAVRIEPREARRHPRFNMVHGVMLFKPEIYGSEFFRAIRNALATGSTVQFPGVFSAVTEMPREEL